MSYITEYKSALAQFAMLSNTKAIKSDIRTGLVALATAEGSIRDKATACGVSVAKVGRDQVAGEWLAAHPKADAFAVKKATDILPATTIRACNSLADLQTAVKAMKAGKVAPPATDDAPEDSTDTPDAPEDTKKITKVTTPDSRMTAANALNMGVLKDMEAGLSVDSDLYKAFISTLNAIATRHNANKGQKVA